ncbi:4-hydroxy-tetrahydrodipicolinate reductase [Desulfofundulus sp. TPOSR]|uniref:4-hydroxy-tetrahydrodipicolinate reductase n=1 Tax=Desulfofundulus kuznetsovii (strain DSM 6115 / VKM B-1805 / 17) TaxID=760568 RepID=A0AAU8PJJ0_DESK7|nr:4-hydroxy-tetrahydrodipicolinate reductase [Desulfofundulus sp. TPOSR]AEG16054.1 Dihydrodipicolinate reductase [Desulfofundulus kuznetsovii DSM 6115]NHM27444.1 4-hydroxy-tetrahydrodipicolinate reductase [Desulfofundulus sp. TPOSR]
MIRVVVTGACGRMGREVLKTVWQAEDMVLVGAVDVRGEGQDVGPLWGAPEVGVTLQGDLEKVLAETRPDVMVDFTTPDVVAENIKTALRHRVRPVVGTTGMSSRELEEIRALAEELKLGCVIAPNFAIGAVLMIRFAAEAARYLPHVEIIELHHDQKLDAPSGTAIKTAEVVAAARGDFRQGLPTEVEKIPGARGGSFDGGIRIHSVRLPGLVAHQEVIFGGLGQTLSIRHDSISRESFMPGVLLAIRRVMHLEGVVYGLENLLFE